ncbi:hypothetical protein RB595_008433 [Gaeumannomyces hyphopodioides]
MSAIPRSATARLRKTFQYPTDDSSFSDSPEILDEDEQESLIQTLAEQNEARNRQFRLVMLALPALSALPYLLLLPAASPLPTLLSLSSLASTAWLLYRQDPTETGVPRLDAWAAASRHHPTTDAVASDDNDDNEADDDDDPSTPLSPAARRRHRERRRRRRRHSSFSLPAGPGGAAQLQQRSPLETHLPLLNAALCAVLLLTGLAIARGGGGGGGGRDGDDAPRLGRAVLACLPATVYAVVVASKLVMASVDPEAELSALRYEAKGA